MGDHTDHFEWNGGHPALDLVNTLDERPSDAPVEKLATYRDLLEFSELAGLIEPRTTAALLRPASRSGSRVVKCVRRLREHLHDVLAAADSGRPARQNSIWMRFLPPFRRRVQRSNWSHRLRRDTPVTAGFQRRRPKSRCMPVHSPSKRC